MARAVVLERVRLRASVAAHVILPPGGLVNVVAKEGHEVGRVGHHMPVGAVIALLVLLARGEDEAQAVHRRAGARRGASTPDRASRIARAEAIPVPALRLETLHFNVERISPRRVGRHFASRHWTLEGLVGENFPAYRDRQLGEVAGQPRPEYDALGGRISGRDAEAERVGGQLRNAGRNTQRPEAFQKTAAVEHPNRITAL